MRIEEQALDPQIFEVRAGESLTASARALQPEIASRMMMRDGRWRRARVVRIACPTKIGLAR